MVVSVQEKVTPPIMYASPATFLVQARVQGVLEVWPATFLRDIYV